jgi:hypothetical protein
MELTFLEYEWSPFFLIIVHNGLAMFSVGFVEFVKLPKTLISQLKYSLC